MLFLHELKQVLVLVKHFSFINRNVSLKQILLTWFNIFAFSCLQTEESSQSIYIQQISDPFSQMYNTRLAQYRYIWHD